jgi:hypothetical protein
VRWNVKKTKEETIDDDIFCSLESTSNVVYLLQGYGGLKTNGVALGDLILRQLLKQRILLDEIWQW